MVRSWRFSLRRAFLSRVLVLNGSLLLVVGVEEVFFWVRPEPPVWRAPPPRILEDELRASDILGCLFGGVVER